MKDFDKGLALVKASRKQIGTALFEGAMIEPDDARAAAFSILTMSVAEFVASLALGSASPDDFVRQSLDQVEKAVRDTVAVRRAAAMKPEGSC